MIGWVNLSLNRNMFDNTVIGSSFVFICIPLAIAVCIASKRKLLPYGLLQLFTGVSILLMIAFPGDKAISVRAHSSTEFKLIILYTSGSQTVVREPLVVCEQVIGGSPKNFQIP